jgi:hypothetical protein
MPVTPMVTARLFEVPDPLPPLEAVRGSIFILDWLALREKQVFAAYEERLGKHHPLFAVTAFDWVPLALTEQHYRALDACELSPPKAREVGRFVGDQVHGKFVGTLVRLAGHLGVSPWLALSQAYKLWLRSFKGGGSIVSRLGGASAHFQVAGVPFVGSPFFRNSFMGAVEATILPFCKQPTAIELEGERSATAFAMRLSWL